MRATAIAFLATCVLVPLSPSHAEEEEANVVQDGKTISLEYTLKLDDGSVVDSNVGEQPLTYEQGSQQILPALEAQIAGMKVDESKQVKLEPEQGYGEVNPELFQEVETSVIPEEARQKGAQLISEDQAGNRRPLRVHEVKGDKIVLDLNHPLAGETLHFDVKVVAVE